MAEKSAAWHAGVVLWTGRDAKRRGHDRGMDGAEGTAGTGGARGEEEGGEEMNAEFNIHLLLQSSFPLTQQKHHQQQQHNTLH